MLPRVRGFALLVAVIFMSVMLAFGIALASIAYKQSVLSSSAVESQYAFYAADAALECTLYADQQTAPPLFSFPSGPAPAAPTYKCDGAAPISASTLSYTPTLWTVGYRFSLYSGARCADVTVYKYAVPQDGTNGTLSLGGRTTYIFSQGYDVSCANIGATNVRYVARGLEAHY